MADLAERMRKLAETHPRKDELIATADALDAATVATPPVVPNIVAAWARARKLWCDCTGEPLL